MKRCGKCKVYKELTEFVRDKGSLDGLLYQCKTCQKERRIKYYDEKRKEKMTLYYKENKKKINQYASAWRKSHPENTASHYQNRRAKKAGVGGRVTAKQWRDLLEKYDHQCLCCRRKGVRLEQDHVIPLDPGTNTIDNIQPLCRVCNAKKHRKTIDYRNDFKIT